MIILFTNIIPEHPCDSGMIRTELRFQQPYTNQVYNIPAPKEKEIHKISRWLLVNVGQRI